MWQSVQQSRLRSSEYCDVRSYRRWEKFFWYYLRSHKRKRGVWGLSVQQERRCEKGCTPSERKTKNVKGVPRTNFLNSEVTALNRTITAQLSYGEEKEKAVTKILTKEVLPSSPFIFEHLPQQSTKTYCGWKMRTGNKAMLLKWLRKKRRTCSLAGNFEIKRNKTQLKYTSLT